MINPSVDCTPLLGFHPSVLLSLARFDQVHPEISGNKWYKLKCVFQEYPYFHRYATFGGPFSNHIAAFSAFCSATKREGLVYIRGEEWKDKWFSSPTLVRASQCGMQLQFLSREEYREQTKQYTEPTKIASDTLLIPEGGGGDLGRKGTKEMTPWLASYDWIGCAVGTGTTVSGLLEGCSYGQEIIGFSALKNAGQEAIIRHHDSRRIYRQIEEFLCGGFGKWNTEYLDFLRRFYAHYNIVLDPLYTGKMLFYISKFPQVIPSHCRNAVCVHTGGLQGNKGFNALLQRKQIPPIPQA